MKTNILQMARCLCSAAVLAAIAACGGGNAGPVTYTIGGTVTGLVGSGLALNSDFGGDLPVSASGSFTFSTRLLNGRQRM